MKYKILVIERESGKVEATIGENLNEYYAEKLEADARLLVDVDKYEIKVINAF